MRYRAYRTLLLYAITAGVVWAQSPLEQAVTMARERRYQDADRLLQGVAEPENPAQQIAFHRLKAAVAAGLGDHADAAEQMRQALRTRTDRRRLFFWVLRWLRSRQAILAARLPMRQAREILRARRRFWQTSMSEPGRCRTRLMPGRKRLRWTGGNEGYRLGLAANLIAQRNFESAIELLDGSLALFTNKVRLRTLLGIAQYASSDTEGAILTLNAAISEGPEERAAYQCLSQIVLRSAAAPSAEVTRNLCRWNSVVCSALKLRVAREKDDPAMQRAAIASLQSAPQTDVVARCELARAWEWAGRLEDARKEMESCLRLDPSAQNHYRLGILYQRLGMRDLAKREMDLRIQLLRDTTEDSEAGLNTLKAFRAGGNR